MTMPFQTTPEQIARIEALRAEMSKAGVDPELVTYASALARLDQGIFDLMALWGSTPGDRPEIEHDLRGSLLDYQANAGHATTKALCDSWQEGDDEGFRLIVTLYLFHLGSLTTMAEQFEAAPGTIRRWASGHARPRPRIQKLVVDWVRSQSFTAREKKLETDRGDVDVEEMLRQLAHAAVDVGRVSDAAGVPVTTGAEAGALAAHVRAVLARFDSLCADVDRLKRRNVAVDRVVARARTVVAEQIHLCESGVEDLEEALDEYDGIHPPIPDEIHMAALAARDEWEAYERNVLPTLSQEQRENTPSLVETWPKLAALYAMLPRS